jgi:hypothetical protein
MVQHKGFELGRFTGYKIQRAICTLLILISKKLVSSTSWNVIEFFLLHLIKD